MVPAISDCESSINAMLAVGDPLAIPILRVRRIKEKIVNDFIFMECQKGGSFTKCNQNKKAFFGISVALVTNSQTPMFE